MSINRGSSFKTSIVDFNLMSFFKALANLVSKYRDSHASYFAFHTVLNLIYTLNLMTPMVNGKSVMSRFPNKGPVDLSVLLLTDLDYHLLTVCLLKSRILSLTLMEPTLEHADPDIMRICSKLMITIVFKASKKRIIIGESEGARLNTQLEDLYRRLDLDIGSEKRT